METVKKALIISYMFPPISGGGTMRPLKFVKYLSDFGIRPIVFCPLKAAWKAYDYTNLELPFLKNVPTYRCGIRRLQRYYHLRYVKGIRRHPYYYLLALKYSYFLDFFSAWYFECRKKALEIGEKEKVDCVFTTSPPHSVHLFGLYLKEKLDIPWIMDIRDAMTIDPNRSVSPGMRVQAAIEKFYEKKFYAAADSIISVSDPIIESIRKRHGGFHLNSRTYTITNGFDPEDFNPLIEKEKTKEHTNRPFTVTYTGSFMGRQTPEYFLQAIQLLIEREALKASDILIRFMGYYDDSTLSSIKKFASLFPIKISKFKPYTEALRHQINSLLLLLIVNIDEHEGGAQTMTGKFFEYVGSQRPIFALVPDGPLKKIIKQGRFGITAPTKDIDTIADKFLAVYDQWKLMGYVEYDPDPDVREKYSRKNLTAALAGIINRLVPQ